MTDAELDQLLQRVPVPEREAEDWEQFPERVIRRLGHAPRSATQPPDHFRRPVLLWGLGFTAACIMIGFALGFRHGRESGSPAGGVAAMRTYYREVEGFFPNQLQAIVMEAQGPRLILSEKADVPASPPLYLRICGPSGCDSFVTFSGQQIRVNGDVFEVLVDHRGDVLVVGRQWVWSSAQAQARSGPYQIEARALEAAS